MDNFPTLSNDEIIFDINSKIMSNDSAVHLIVIQLSQEKGAEAPFPKVLDSIQTAI